MFKLLVGFALGLVARPAAYGFMRWYWKNEDNSSDLQPKRPEYLAMPRVPDEQDRQWAKDYMEWFDNINALPAKSGEPVVYQVGKGWYPVGEGWKTGTWPTYDR